MTLEELSHLSQQLIQAYWPLVALGIPVLWLLLFITGVITVVLQRKVIRELRALRGHLTDHFDQPGHQEYLALHQELKALLCQASQWNGRIAALYPSVADLIDDKLAMLALSNGHHE